MRAAPSAILTCLAVLAGTAWATSANDRADDEVVILRTSISTLGHPCRAPGADILHYSANVVGEEIVLGVGVANDDPRLHCGVPVGTASHFVPELKLEPVEGGPSLYLIIDSPSACGHVEIPGVGATRLCSAHSHSGKDVQWRIPVQPTVTRNATEFTLDLRGVKFLYSADVTVHGSADPLAEMTFTATDEAGFLPFRVPAPAP